MLLQLLSTWNRRTLKNTKVKHAYPESQQSPSNGNIIKVKKMKTIANIVMIFQTNFISAVYLEDQSLTKLVLTKHFPFKYCTFPQAICKSVKIVFVSVNNIIKKR